MGKVKILMLPRMNYTNKYKNEMGVVEISDDLRNYYKIYFG